MSHIKRFNVISSKVKLASVFLGPHSFVYLCPWMCLNLWEFEFGVVGVHLAYLLARGRAEDLDDLHQLVHAAVAREDGLAQEQLRQNAPS